MAERLVSLTAMGQPAEVQIAAYAALARLTGIARFGDDRGQWTRWWEPARRLNVLEWTRHLLANFARQRARGRSIDEQLADKLREAERALYQASSPQDQAGVLAYMLDNPLEATRLLAIGSGPDPAGAGRSL